MPENIYIKAKIFRLDKEKYTKITREVTKSNYFPQSHTPLKIEPNHYVHNYKFFSPPNHVFCVFLNTKSAHILTDKLGKYTGMIQRPSQISVGRLPYPKLLKLKAFYRMFQFQTRSPLIYCIDDQRHPSRKISNRKNPCSYNKYNYRNRY